MDARGLHAVDRPYGTGQLSLQRAQVIDVLHKAGGAERVGFVENLVADAAALGQAALGKLHAQPCHPVLGHHDHRAVVLQLERAGLALEILDDAGGILRGQVGEQSGHRGRGDPHDDESEESDQRGGDRDHRHYPGSTQTFQETRKTLQRTSPWHSAQDSASRADWAIIAYGMVSIWLMKVKGGGELSSTQKKSAFRRKADFLKN